MKTFRYKQFELPSNSEVAADTGEQISLINNWGAYVKNRNNEKYWKRLLLLRLGILKKREIDALNKSNDE